MNSVKPDSFVMMVALLSDKLVQKENHIATLQETISEGVCVVRDLDDTVVRLRDECDDLRVQVANLQDCNARQRSTISDLEFKVRNSAWYQTEYERVLNEMLALKYGDGTPEERAAAYMKAEGGRLWKEGAKIAAIKGVRECTRWGLKEAKDYVEANGDRFAPKPTVEEETPSGTKRSQDLSRSA